MYAWGCVVAYKYNQVKPKPPNSEHITLDPKPHTQGKWRDLSFSTYPEKPHTQGKWRKRTSRDRSHVWMLDVPVVA